MPRGDKNIIRNICRLHSIIRLDGRFDVPGTEIKEFVRFVSTIRARFRYEVEEIFRVSLCVDGECV